MKKLLFIVLVLVLVGGVIFHLFLLGQKVKEQKIFWGATIRPYALNTLTTQGMDTREAIKQEFAYLKELGANSFRFNLESDTAINDFIVDEGLKNKLEPIVILEKNGVSFSTPANFYQSGYEFANEIAQRYGEKINFYQLANEVSGTAARRAGDTGETLPNDYNLFYDKNRYNNLKDYLRGLSEGVKAANPQAKRIITGHWVLSEIMNYLARDGVGFEIIGWDWYSDMGTDITAKPIDEGGVFNLVEKFAPLKKEVWLVEVNRDGGSFGGKETEQARFIQELGQNIAKSGVAKGFLVHPLIDLAQDNNQAIGQLGLIKLELNPQGNWQFGQKKLAFTTYQNVISQNPYPSTQTPSWWGKLALSLRELIESF